MIGRPPSHRPSFKPNCYGRLYRRAISGDPEFGHICPSCAGPKTDQALMCRGCRREAQITTFVRDKRRRGMVEDWTNVAPARSHHRRPRLLSGE